MMVFFLILLVIFIVLSWYIVQFPDNPLDQMVLVWFQTQHHELLTVIAQQLSWLGGLPSMLLFSAFIVICAYLKKDEQTIYFVIFGISLTVFTSWSFKWLFARDRPVLDIVLIDTYGSSFPSAHSAYAMMFACILIYWWRRHTVIWLTVTLVGVLWVFLMGCSRMYLGVHYLTDVLAGWILAAMVMLLIKMKLN